VDLSYTVLFGPDGLPLTEDNQSYFVGYVYGTDIGDMTLFLTVTSIVTNVNSVEIRYDAAVSEEGTLLTGIGSDTYTLQAGGELEVVTSATLRDTDPDLSITMSLDGIGALYSGSDTFRDEEPPAEGTVLVLLDNRAGFAVDPRVFAHPDEMISFNDLVADKNSIELFDPPELQPDELGANAAELLFHCEDARAITSYIAFLFLSEEGNQVAESNDSPDLRQGTDFVCGDEITFIYEVDENGAFRTFVHINGELH
jgi:hypothetical protein